MLSLLAALAVSMQDTTVRAPAPADTYADTGAAQLVAAARERRSRQERLVTAYSATVSQRIGVGIRALRRDRMLFRQEMVARIDWRRDSTTRITMLGARQAIPIAIAGIRVPDDLDDHAAFLAFDPAADYLRLVGEDAEGFIHPLADGAEQQYRYTSGDTTRITLPGGREIRLLELRVTPRHSSFRLMAGSLWFDADSYGVVRAVFRPARPFDLELDGDSGDTDDVPGVLRPIRAEVRYVTLEYGLYEFRWWLPRLVALDAEASVGGVMRVPVRFERTYVMGRVQGGGEPPAGANQRWRAGGQRPPRPGKDLDSTINQDSLASAIAACIAQARAGTASDSVSDTSRTPGAGSTSRDRRRAERAAARRCSRRSPDRPDVAVIVPADTQSLLTSADLGAPILDMGDIISERELRDLGREIGALPATPWQFRRSLRWGLVRYNRVEALSLGARFTSDFGRLRADLTGRIGLGDREPDVEVGLLRPGRSAESRLAAYHRLASVDPASRALGIGNSVSALLFGRDDGDYFRATGVEVIGAPALTHSHWYDVRVFVEHQDVAAKETDATLVRLFDSSRRFRPAIPAVRATQAGASATLRGYRAFASGFGVGADLKADGQTGDFDFARGALTTRATVPLRKLVAAAELAAGSSVGPVPAQSLWYLGGPTTLRGYGGNAARGDAFWRARTEVATNLPAARAAVFFDAGWAGTRSQLGRGAPLTSVGVGASFLDGLFRVDLGHALRGSKGWRLDFYADGVL